MSINNRATVQLQCQDAVVENEHSSYSVMQLNTHHMFQNMAK